MKIILLILVVVVTRSWCFNLSIGSVNGLSNALKDFVLKRVPVKNIRIISSDSKQDSSDFINELTSELGVKTKVALGFPRNHFATQVNVLVVVLIESLKSFDAVRDKLLVENLFNDKKCLLVLLNDVVDSATDNLKAFWSRWVYNVNVLSATEDGRVSMHTFFPFAKESCGDDFNLELINEFDPATNEWCSKDFFPDKFTNITDCPLRVAVLSSIGPSVLVDKSETTGEKSYSGFEVDIIKEVLREFKMSFQFEDFDVIGNVYQNGTVQQGMLPALYEKKFDVALGTLSLQLERLHFLSATKSFLAVPIVFVVPPPSVTTPFQKLIQPFTLLVWILFLALFLIGFIVTFVLRICAPRTAYNFVVGKGVKNPFLNMLIAFFGGTQVKLPRTNFARFLLMKFLLFCLVIRCIYQGKLFFMLRAELHDRQIETISEAIERNMVFYTYESLNKRIQGFKFFNRCISVPRSQLGNFLQKTLDPSFNGIVFNYLTQVLYLNSIHYQNFTYHIADESFVTNHFVFYFQRNHFLIEKVSDKIDTFKQAGLIQKLISKYVDYRFLDQVQPENAPSVLNVSHLSAVFGIWISFLVLSVVIFIAEVLWKQIKDAIARMTLKLNL